MRWMVDDVLAGGVDCAIVAEVAHRTSILPMVMSGVGHAVMPSSWRPARRTVGSADVDHQPEVMLHVALLSRPTGLTPAAESFLTVARGLRQDASTLIGRDLSGSSVSSLGPIGGWRVRILSITSIHTQRRARQ